MAVLRLHADNNNANADDDDGWTWKSERCTFPHSLIIVVVVVDINRAICFSIAWAETLNVLFRVVHFDTCWTSSSHSVLTVVCAPCVRLGVVVDVPFCFAHISLWLAQVQLCLVTVSFVSSISHFVLSMSLFVVSVYHIFLLVSYLCLFTLHVELTKQ